MFVIDSTGIDGRQIVLAGPFPFRVEHILRDAWQNQTNSGNYFRYNHKPFSWGRGRGKGPKHIEVTTFTFQGHVTSLITISAISYRTSMFNGLRDICIQIYLGHNLGLLESRDVIGHVTIRCGGVISYRCSIVTVSVSPAIVELIRPRSRDVVDYMTIRFDICHRAGFKGGPGGPGPRPPPTEGPHQQRAPHQTLHVIFNVDCRIFLH